MGWIRSVRVQSSTLTPALSQRERELPDEYTESRER
jgi:hypothetical protein